MTADVGRKNEMKIHIYAILLALAYVGSSFAGLFWPVACQNPECNFKGTMDCGGGWRFGKVCGFCTTCRKIVEISWTIRPDPTNDETAGGQDLAVNNTPPKKIGSIWNPATGIISDLYSCPYCKNPFAEFDSVALSTAQMEGEVFCPMCTNLTLKIEHYGNYD